MTPCAVCGSPTAFPVRYALHGWDGIGAPFVACRLCRDYLVTRPPRGMRLVNADGSPFAAGGSRGAGRPARRLVDGQDRISGGHGGRPAVAPTAPPGVSRRDLGGDPADRQFSR